MFFFAPPRTLKGLNDFGLTKQIEPNERIKLLDPVPYVKFMRLVTGAQVVTTDSGGLQEETTYLGTPCLTRRENTERPITVTLGTNKLADAEQLMADLRSVLSGNWKSGTSLPLWNGKNAKRAAQKSTVF